ncbi:MAG: sulfite exporter TauE/SafE family protein [Candidatus Limnocylindrales bacterium]
MDIFSGLLLVGLIGIAAQLVDGSLGMGYGVTSATLLAGLGYSPAMASATIHLAKIGTGVASGASHWRFGNVHWRAVALLAVPGAIGAFAGAFALSYLAADVARPWVALVLAVLGVIVIVRTVLRRSPAIRVYQPRLRSLGPLGLAGGFIDSVGGGGWGPVTTSSLMAANRMAPNQVIGTVSTAEIVVAIAASAGFLLALGSAGIAWGAMVALLIGGAIAAPIAAWAVSRVDHAVLGGLVGGMILFYNAEGVLSLAGIEGSAVMVVRVLIVAGALGLTLSTWLLRDRTRTLPSEAVPVEAGSP